MQIKEVLRLTPRKRQTLLFSATMTEEVRDLVALSLQRPVRLAADAAGAAPRSLIQEVVRFKGAAAVAAKEGTLLALCARSFRCPSSSLHLPPYVSVFLTGQELQNWHAASHPHLLNIVSAKALSGRMKWRLSPSTQSQYHARDTLSMSGVISPIHLEAKNIKPWWGVQVRADHCVLQHQAQRTQGQDPVWAGGPAPRGRAARQHDPGRPAGVP